MGIIVRTIISVVLFLASPIVSTASGGDQTTASFPKYLPEYGSALPPMGFVEFCLRGNSLCEGTYKTALLTDDQDCANM